MLLCVEEVAQASTSSHLSSHFDGFMVHRDVPPMTSSQQFLDDLATHLRTTTGFTIPFELKEHFSFTQLLVRIAQQTHRLVPPLSPSRGAGRPGRGSGTGPSSPLVAHRCSNVVRAHVLAPAFEDFDKVNAMTNLVVQAVRTVFATRRRTHLSGSGATWRMRAECAP